jgi:hypothetical protein
VKRVATSELLAEIGHFRNVLQQNGIACVVRNEQLSGALGEVPFLECLPELWILNEADLGRAERLLAELRAPAVAGEPWRCRHCGAENEGEFSACWSCERADTAEGDDAAG